MNVNLNNIDMDEKQDIRNNILQSESNRLLCWHFHKNIQNFILKNIRNKEKKAYQISGTGIH